jgi:LPS-assembly lipoprotein
MTRKSTLILALAAAVGLAACTVTPLYSEASDGTPIAAELAAASVLPAEERLTQIVRNELIFAFGNQAAAPRYELSLSARSSGGPAIPGDDATLGRVSVTVDYALIEIASGAGVASGSASAATSYRISNQAFATLRAMEDAETRAARAAAESIRVEIAAALALRR